MMDWNRQKIKELFSPEGSGRLLLDGNWGLEKESLRVTADGRLALSPHPAAFGDKINNPHITVDFSESQLELITPVFQSIEETFDFLSQLQSFVEESIGDELLWPTSMPGRLPPESRIPLASYSGNEKGREKEIYRSGLALRYGKKMQMISGIHYNFSFGEAFWEYLHAQSGGHLDLRSFRDDLYMNLVRSFLKYRWLLIFLFGASPLGTEEYISTFTEKNDCVCQKACRQRTFENPVQYATSLRMSRFGYENSYQDLIDVSYNTLNGYLDGLYRALNKKVNRYSEIGSFRDGRQVQLNDNLLQSEAEFYAPVRLKRVPNQNTTMLEAIADEGIQYLEFRIFDLDPFERTGISLQQMHFIHVFLLFCFFQRTGDLTEADVSRFSDNAQLAALFGRSEQLQLKQNEDRRIGIRDWAEHICHQLMDIARILDDTNTTGKFQRSVKDQLRKLENIEFLPSSTIVNIMTFNGESHEQFGLDRAVHNLGERSAVKTAVC